MNHTNGKPAKQRPVYIVRSKVRHISTCTPAVRTVVVCAFAWLDEGSIETAVEVLPVLALQTRVVDRWHLRLPHGEQHSREYATVAELKRAGFEYSGQETEHSVLFLHDAYGIIAAIDLWKYERGEVYRIVPCPGPADADEQAIAAAVGEALDDAREHEVRRIEQEAKS